MLLSHACPPRVPSRLYGEFVWRFQPITDTALPYHRFKRGDTVVVAQQSIGGGSSGSGTASSSGDESDYSSSQAPQPAEQLEGTVLEVQRDGLLVTVPKTAADALSEAGRGAGRWRGCLSGRVDGYPRCSLSRAWYAGWAMLAQASPCPTLADPSLLCYAGAMWRLDQGSSSVTVARQLDALNRLGQVGPGSSQGEVAVRALLLGAPNAERLAAKPTAWVQEAGWLQKARQRLGAVPHLNKSQKEAIAFALSRTLTLWQVRAAGRHWVHE